MSNKAKKDYQNEIAFGDTTRGEIYSMVAVFEREGWIPPWILVRIKENRVAWVEGFIEWGRKDETNIRKQKNENR